MSFSINTVFNLLYSPRTALLVLVYFVLRHYVYHYLYAKYYCNYVKKRKNDRIIGAVPSEEEDRVLTALETQTIFDNIFRHLTTPDILQCSLVSQLWKKRSREFLRNKKRCIILLRTLLCPDLKNLYNMLENSTDLPFIGLHFQPIILDFRVLFQQFGESQLLCSHTRKYKEQKLSQYPLLFQLLPVKYLFINYPKRWDCLCDEFLRNLLQKAADSTEYLEIMNWPKDIGSLQDYLNSVQASLELQVTYRFQNLRVFKIDCSELLRTIKSKLIVDVVDSAPSLRKVCGTIFGRILVDGSSLVGPQYSYLPESKIQLIEGLSIESDWELYKLAKTELKLEVLSLCPTIFRSTASTIGNEVVDKSRVDRCLKRVIGCSQDSLVVMSLFSHLLPFSVTNNCPLFNLRQLVVRFKPAYSEFQEMCNLLQTTDFQKCVPNLTEISVVIEESNVVMAELTLDTLTNSPKFQCMSVSTLKIRCKDTASRVFYKDNNVRIWDDLAEIFPRIRSLDTPDSVDDKDFWDNVGIPWRRSLESVSCVWDDISADSGVFFWKTLIRLLMYLCCDISPEEFISINGSQVLTYVYGATRTPVCKEFGLKSVKLQLNHQILCTSTPTYDLTGTNWHEVFEKISIWMGAKFPDFEFQMDYKPCAEIFCNPLCFPVGIQIPTITVEGLDGRRLGTRTLCLTAWSDIGIKMQGRSRFSKFGDHYCALFTRYSNKLHDQLGDCVYSWKCLGVFFMSLNITYFFWSIDTYVEICEFTYWLWCTFSAVYFYFVASQYQERLRYVKTRLLTMTAMLAGLILPEIILWVVFSLRYIIKIILLCPLYFFGEVLPSQQIIDHTSNNNDSFYKLLYDMNNCNGTSDIRNANF